ncbi:TadE/TadG family type IV pilus assembly protein [Vibrio mediterranei]|uniref:TadE/TadG family type IV pilus assembly protein n=1 Tax=Vibrio mediterranei TaxID=689 RepID=UPI00148E2048|nr:TadE/TadG family type IV pilus assembly protein [Vibrio mediterranei]NOI24331.1 pilus assembly protein [Vibrio mediterranei]
MNSYKKSQSGITIIEFSIVLLGALILMFAAFEFGRYVFSMQMLNEMSRKAARLAVVCSISDRDDIADLPEVSENRPVGFVATNLSIDYVDSTGASVNVDNFATLSEDDQNFVMSQVRFVRAEITGYQFQFFPLLSFIGTAGAISTPSFPTILPVESLGIVRPNTGETAGVVEDC